MTLNGVRAGLVAITSPCATVTTAGAVPISLFAGVIVVFAVLFFDRIGVDDPVGAVSVHGVCGAWGTPSAALFHENLFLGLPDDLGAQLLTQAIGVLAAFVWSFGTCFLLFEIIAKTIGLRVSAEEELEGLALSEHGANCYPDFAALGALGSYSPLVSPARASSSVMAPSQEPAEA
jgi:Amt family ammonium transporter